MANNGRSVLNRGLPVPMSINTAWRTTRYLGLLVASIGFAAHERFKHLSLEDGLSQVSVLCLIQDHEDFIWFGTAEGLNRFDGYKFTVFRHSPREADSLSSSYIYSLVEDRENRLWVGTRKGLDRYDRDRGGFVRYAHPLVKHVTFVGESDQGFLWVGTLNEGLWRFYPDRMHFEPLTPNRDPAPNMVLNVLEEPETLWIGSSGGLLRMSNEETRPQMIALGDEMPDSINHIFRDSFGRLWVCTEKGLFYKPDDADFQDYILEPEYGQVIAVEYMFQDSLDRIWFGTDLGLFRLAPDQTLTRFREGEGWGLRDNWVRSMIEGRDRILWFGTTTAGAAYLDMEAKSFGSISSRGPEGYQLAGDRVIGIHVDQNGILWVGSYGYGLTRLDREERSSRYFKHDPNDESSLSSNQISVVYTDLAERLWVGTWQRGLNVMLDDETGFRRFGSEPGKTTSLLNDSIRTIMEDSSYRLWVGTIGGLNLADRVEGTFQRFPFNPEGESLFVEVSSISEDEDGTFWVGTEGVGLARFFPDEGRYEWPARNSMPAIDERVMSLLPGEGRLLWVGTGKGLYRLDKADMSTRFYDRDDGLSNDTIYALLPDRQRRIWISTNAGISCFNPATEVFRNYDTGDGVTGTEFNRGGYYHDPDTGELFFGSISGLTHFFPQLIVDNAFVPPIRVTELMVNHQPVTLRNERDASGALVLDYSDKIFSLEFAALAYADPQKNQYAYRLEPFEQSWISVDAERRIATYTNLPAGSYRFRVKGSNQDGLWNESGLTLRLEIRPPPWRTWWALLIYGALTVSFLWWYLSLQRDRLMRERRIAEQERQVAEKDRQIAEQARLTAEHLRQLDRLKDEFLANTSHELRTPLNGIIGLAESLLDGAGGPMSTAARNNLDMIVSCGRRLANLVNDILDFSKLKNHSLDLNRQPVDLFALVDVVLALTHPLTRGKSLELISEIPIDLPPAYGDEDRLQQIMLNLVGNAVKFTEKGRVTISAEQEDARLVIRVADTGIGIPEEKFAHIFKSFEQLDGTIIRQAGGTGLGLAITRKLVELHDGHIQVASRVGEGSVFSFTLPIATEDPPGAMEESIPAIEIEPKPSVDDASVPAENTDKVPALKRETPFRILVVDDEPVNRLVLLNHLSLHDYRVTEASGGPEAMRILADEEPFDLILLDIMMPGMSGYQFCEELRNRYPLQELPVIFLTARNRASDMMTGFSSGANDFLTKPVNKVELLSRVRTHLQLLDTNRNLEARVVNRTRELSEKNQELETLDGIVRAINREHQLHRVFDTLLEQGMRLLPRAEKACLLLLDREQHYFYMAADIGYLERHRQIRFSPEGLNRRYTGVTQQVGEDIFLARDTGELPEVMGYPDAPPKSLLTLVLRIEGTPIGFLVWDNHEEANAFDHADVQRLIRFREHALTAVARARLVDTLKARNDELLKTRDQLVMQEKMASLGTLTAGIAHELQNPLNFVTNFSGLGLELAGEVTRIIQGPEIPARLRSEIESVFDELKENLEQIDRHGRRAERIVSSMTELIREEPGHRQQTPLNSLIRELAEITVNSNRAQIDVALCLTLDPGIGMLDLVPRSMAQTISGLIINSLDAIREKYEHHNNFQPKIEVTSRDDRDHVEIVVEDNGMGMPEERMKRIFTPFFTTRPADSGRIGLGLSLIYDIVVSEHGGSISVDSRPGEYTRVTLILPKPGTGSLS